MGLCNNCDYQVYAVGLGLGLFCRKKPNKYKKSKLKCEDFKPTKEHLYYLRKQKLKRIL